MTPLATWKKCVLGPPLGSLSGLLPQLQAPSGWPFPDGGTVGCLPTPAFLFEVVDGRSHLLPVPFRPVVAWRQVRYSGTAPCGHDVDRERFGAVVPAQHQEPGCQGDRGQLASARSVLGPGRHRLRRHVAHDLPRAVRGQPYQSAGLADIGLALPRRTLACQAPRVPAGSSGARGHLQALARHLLRRGSALSPFSRPSHSRFGMKQQTGIYTY